jgi:transketolase
MNPNMACREAFTASLLDLARADRSIIALTSDARGSVSLGEFAAKLPDQFVEVGIAEQNAVGIAAGLASCGKRPFVCAPACFLSARSLEQIKVDVAYAHTNVKIIGVSGGISYGALGLSHHSLHDIAAFRAIPGISVLLPCDARQAAEMTAWLAASDDPAYVRMGRGPVPAVYSETDAPFQFGVANVLRRGSDLAIIAAGETVRHALDAAQDLSRRGIEARVIDMHTLKPLDEEAVIRAARETGRIVTVEEHSLHGGLGGAVAETTARRCPIPMRILAIPDEATISGNSAELFDHYGLNARGIVKASIELLDYKYE